MTYSRARASIDSRILGVETVDPFRDLSRLNRGDGKAVVATVRAAGAPVDFAGMELAIPGELGIDGGDDLLVALVDHCEICTVIFYVGCG